MRRIPYAKPAKRKASPGGEAGATFVATDEVEAIDYHQGLVQNVTFDLIRHAIRRDTFPWRGRLFSVTAGTASICTAPKSSDSGRGVPPPLQCHAVRLSENR